MTAKKENEIIRILNSLEASLQSKALWLRGNQAYKEYIGFSINRVREAKKEIMDLKVAPVEKACVAEKQMDELKVKLQTAIYRLCCIEERQTLSNAEKALIREWITDLRT